VFLAQIGQYACETQLKMEYISVTHAVPLPFISPTYSKAVGRGEQFPPVAAGEWYKTASRKYFVTNNHKRELDKVC